MDIYSFVMETTRRCNMRCGHCLRGDPQNKTMSNSYMRLFLSQINYISSVSFTGGEPTLPSGIQVMWDFMEICNIYGVDVGSFYMVTNAKIWRPELPRLISALYNFCSDNEISCVDISTDQYHEHRPCRRMSFKSRLEDILMYEYGIEEIVSSRPDINWDQVLHEGRGKQYGTYKYFEPSDIYLEEEEDSYVRLMDCDIYLNCEGNLINGCDWSYASQRKPENIICAAKDDFEKAVRQFDKLQITETA